MEITKYNAYMEYNESCFIKTLNFMLDHYQNFSPTTVLSFLKIWFFIALVLRMLRHDHSYCVEILYIDIEWFYGEQPSFSHHLVLSNPFGNLVAVPRLVVFMMWTRYITYMNPIKATELIMAAERYTANSTDKWVPAKDLYLFIQFMK